jgi:DNA-directed RNA polymerase subunit RPC12/RpoP
MKLHCPACDALLSTAHTLKPGRKVKCPGCGHRFLYPGESTSSPAIAPPAPEQTSVVYQPIVIHKPIVLSRPHKHHVVVPPQPVLLSEIVDDPGENYGFADHGDYDQHFGPNRSMRTPDGIVYGFSMASDPISVTVSREKVKLLMPDTRAAVVLTIEPLRVAAYTDEFDCVAILRFTDKVDDYYRLKVGDRLLTVNTYDPTEGKQARDLIPGDRYRGTEWSNFCPFIADFLSDDFDVIEKRKRAISEDEWQRTRQLGMERLRKKPRRARHGNPLYVKDPAIKWDD